MEKPVPFSRNAIKELISLHEGGMRGIGEKYKTLIELAAHAKNRAVNRAVMIKCKEFNLVV